MKIESWWVSRAVPVILLALASSGCMRSPEAKSAAYVEAGKKLMQNNDPARAILQFRNAAQATPKNPEVYYQLGVALIAAGDIRNGILGLRKTLELDPKHTGAQLRLAELMTYVDDPTILKDAQQRLQSLLQDDPENKDALHALALSELKLGNPKNAMQNLEHAISAAPQELILSVTLAAAKVQEGDIKGAEKILKDACERSPKSPDAVVSLGRFYAFQQRLPDAEREFNRALALDANHAAALSSLATIQYQAGRKQDAEQNFKRLSTLPDKQFNASYATFLFQEGKQAEAVKEFERLAKLDSNDRAARSRLVGAYQGAGRLADAQKVLSDALKQNPKDLDALLQRGELFLDARKFAEAEADLNSVMHLKPDSPEVHYIFSRLHEARGATLRQRQELGEALRLDPTLLQARIELAKSLIKDKSGKAALDTLNQAPNDQRNMVLVVEQRNWALMVLDQLAEARRGVEAGLAAARTSDLLLQDAILKVDTKNYAEAQKSVREILTRNPEDLRALRLLVATYSAQKQMSKAVEEVRAFAQQHASSAEIQYFWGNLLLQTGDNVQAKKVLAGIKSTNPDSLATQMSMAQVELQQANWSDARRELTSVLSANAENPLAHQWRGTVEASAGNAAPAIADFRKVVDSQPTNVIALNNLAYLLAENGQADEALKYAEKAKELAPENPDVQDTLGWVLYQKGLYPLAIKSLEVPNGKQVTAIRHYHLAMAYLKAGNPEKGRTALDAALRLDPKLPEAKSAQVLFK